MATHSGILAQRIPWTEEPGRLTVHRVAKSWAWLKRLSMHTHTPTSMLMPQKLKSHNEDYS